MVPGKPISTHGMTQKLNRHGIPVRPARNGALAALAADLPSPILADVTGMRRHTALRWVAYARRDWAVPRSPGSRCLGPKAAAQMMLRLSGVSSSLLRRRWSQ
ncbi:hypothetical protein SAMN05428940_6532 [Streptomyces sp. 2133.1]|nr:hypothetical protein BX261_6506 [Streptomyces sp. 2321.6]SED98005.1 hypothetical protein SAMN05428940_6532 [Streptomyces sp. 2133.1]